MKIKVIKGYVSHEKKLFGAGAVLDLSDDMAERLIASGTVEAVSPSSGKKEVQKAEQPKQKAKAKKQEPEPSASADSGIELPAADPVASVKKRERK